MGKAFYLVAALSESLLLEGACVPPRATSVAVLPRSVGVRGWW